MKTSTYLRVVSLFTFLLLTMSPLFSGVWYYDQYDDDQPLADMYATQTTWYACGKSGSIFRNAGSGWSQMTTPASTSNLNAIDGKGYDNVWAVGDNGTVFFFDGTSWTQDTTFATDYPTVNLADVSVYVSGSTTHVFVAGSADNNGIVLHRTLTSKSGSALADANAGSWIACDTSRFWGTSTSNPGSVWAAHQNAVFVTVGAQLHKWDGTEWSTLDISTVSGNAILRDIWGTASDSVYIVGLGIIAHYNGSTFTAAEYYSNYDSYHCITGTSATDIWVGGTDNNTDGLIVRYNGSSWSSMSTNITGAGINAIGVLSETQVAALGDVYPANLIRYSDSNTISSGSSTPGELKWSFATGDRLIAAPAIGPDGTIYATSESGTVFAIDTSGQKKWEYATYAKLTLPPVIADDGTIYVCVTSRYTSDKLIALSSSGTLQWELSPSTENRINFKSSPALTSNGDLLLGMEDSTARKNYLLSVTSSGVMGTTLQTSGATWPTIASDGTIYAGCDDYNYNSISPKLYIISTDGTTERYYNGTGVHPVIGANGALYLSDWNKKVVTLTNTPDPNYGAYSESWNYATNMRLSAAPVIGTDGTIYVGDGNGKFYAINADGSKKWEFDTWTDDSGSSIYAAAAIGADGTIYLGTGKKIFYALNTDGTVKWSYTTGGAIRSAPAIGSDGTLYFGSDDGMLYAVNGGSGGLANTPWPKFGGNNQNTAHSAYTAATGGTTTNTGDGDSGNDSTTPTATVTLLCDDTTLSSGETLQLQVQLSGTIPAGASLYGALLLNGQLHFLPSLSTSFAPMSTAPATGTADFFTLSISQDLAQALSGIPVTFYAGLFDQNVQLQSNLSDKTIQFE